MGVITDFFVASGDELKAVLSKLDGPLELGHLPHVEFKSVDHVKLATLQSLLCKHSFEKAIDEIGKPVDLVPTTPDAEFGVHRLPEPLVDSLAALSEEGIATTAKWWATTEELKLDRFSADDAKGVLRELHRLASIAKKDKKGLYLYWSL